MSPLLQDPSVTQVTRNVPPGLEEYNPFSDSKTVSLLHMFSQGQRGSAVFCSMLEGMNLAKVITSLVFLWNLCNVKLHFSIVKYTVTLNSSIMKPSAFFT